MLSDAPFPVVTALAMRQENSCRIEGNNYKNGRMKEQENETTKHSFGIFIKRKFLF